MLKFIIILIVAWFVGVWGWSQIIGSIQNLSTRKSLLFPLILWVVIMSAGACFAIFYFDGLWALVIGYCISILQVISSGKIE